MKKIFKYTIASLTVLSLILTSCGSDETEETIGEGSASEIVFGRDIVIKHLSFINENEGWIYAQDNEDYVLFHSTDSFNSYDVINTDMPSVSKLTFINENIGFADAYNGRYYTLDGGVTWTEFVAPPSYANVNGWMSYNDDYFITPLYNINSDANNPNKRFVGGVFYNLADGSYSHQVEYVGSNVMTTHGSTGGLIHQTSIHVGNNGKTSIVGIDNYNDTKMFTLFSSNSTDSQVTEILGNHSAERLEFPTDNVGFYTQKDDNNLYKTSDSGETWASVYTFNTGGSSNTYKKLSFVDDNNGLVFTLGKLFFTTDGGNTFSEFEVDKGNYLYAGVNEVDFVTSNTVYIIAGYIDNDSDETIKLIKVNR